MHAVYVPIHAQVYNKLVLDLLGDGAAAAHAAMAAPAGRPALAQALAAKHALQVMDDRDGRVVVKGLSTHPVASAADAIAALQVCHACHYALARLFSLGCRERFSAMYVSMLNVCTAWRAHAKPSSHWDEQQQQSLPCHLHRLRARTCQPSRPPNAGTP